MAMTLEDFAHRCLMIKAGNATLDIPCCANCKNYQNVGTIEYSEWICRHPEQVDVDSDRDAEFSWLETKPEDFCSRFEPRKD